MSINIYTNPSRLMLVNVIYAVTIKNSSQTFEVEIIFLGLLYKLTQHQIKTEGQGPDLIITDQQNFL